MGRGSHSRTTDIVHAVEEGVPSLFVDEVLCGLAIEGVDTSFQQEVRERLLTKGLLGERSVIDKLLDGSEQGTAHRPVLIVQIFANIDVFCPNLSTKTQGKVNLRSRGIHTVKTVRRTRKHHRPIDRYGNTREFHAFRELELDITEHQVKGCVEVLTSDFAINNLVNDNLTRPIHIGNKSHTSRIGVFKVKVVCQLTVIFTDDDRTVITALVSLFCVGLQDTGFIRDGFK